MFELITCNLMGTNVSVVVTGIPVVITGEVVNSGREGILALRNCGRTIYIKAELIAFVF
jgi:hypothetical protein